MASPQRHKEKQYQIIQKREELIVAVSFVLKSNMVLNIVQAVS